MDLHDGEGTFLYRKGHPVRSRSRGSTFFDCLTEGGREGWEGA
jgi:hypothetical protein